jgi:endonuclease/exonuclease/phosphatase family metal-dependent hydrolase
MARIGTWNLENLFRPAASSGQAILDTYSAKLDAMAATITEMAPDVLAVQEVGDPEALSDLGERVGGAWHQYTANPDGRGIRVGFLSRTHLTDVVQVAAFPSGLRPVQVDDTATSIQAMGRPALSARVVLDDGTGVDLVSCHLKSKLLTFPGGRFSTTDEDERARFGAYALYRRTSEAVTVRAHSSALLSGLGTERAILVMGDLNDEPNAATTQILLGPPGSEIGTAGFERPDQGDAHRLWNLAAKIPEGHRYSRIYRGRRELIDHILASHTIARTIQDGDINTYGPTPASITDNPTAPRDIPGSDHRPLLLTIDL